MHTNLNQALATFEVPADSVTQLAASVTELHTSVTSMSEQVVLTKATWEQAESSAPTTQNLRRVTSCIDQLGGIETSLKKRAQQHTASSEQMLMYKQQVAKS